MNANERIKKEIIPFTEEHVKDYLDNAIRAWRLKRDEGEDDIERKVDKLIAGCYVDAFQSVRETLFGELLPMEE